MDSLQIAQFVIVYVDGNRKKQPGISSIYEFVVIVFDKIRVLFVPCSDKSVDLGLYSGFFYFGTGNPVLIRWWRYIPFRQACFTLTVLEKKKTNLRR